MTKIIDYYLTPASPWTYLGHARFLAMAEQAGAQINVKPVDFGKIFPLSGGLPLGKRAPQRQAYRFTELARWRDHLGVPINVKPAFFPVAGDPASLMITAAQDISGAAALALAGAALAAVWNNEQNIADPATLVAIANSCGLDGAHLQSQAATPEVAARYAANTDEAITRNVFGAPTYIVDNDGELFWGQDRLDFLARKLTA